MTLVLRKASEETREPIKIINDVPGCRLMGITIFDERSGPIKVSELLKEQGIHLTEEDIAEGRKMEENSEEVPEIETLRELPNYYDLQQVWVRKHEFYVDPKVGDVFSQSTDMADFETGVMKITGEYRNEILRYFKEVRSWMSGVGDIKDLTKRLRSSLLDLRNSGIIPISNPGFSQYPAQEKELIKKLREKGHEGYIHLSRPVNRQNLEVCYGNTQEEKEEFWPWPNFLVRDIANKVTFSFQENGVPYIFRGDVYSPILIPLKQEGN